MRIWPWLLVLAGPLYAAEQESKPVLPAGSELTGQLLQLLVGLLLVIAVIFLLAWLVRRIQHSLPASSNKQVIRLVATQPLGPRERLLLVQVGKEQVLLGLTPGTIEPLHVLQEPIQIEPPAEGAADFAGKLRFVLGKQQAGERPQPEQPKEEA